MKLADTFSAQLDKIKEQEWYQQLQASFQQLSPEQQLYVKWGSVAGSFIVLFYFGFSTLLMAKSAKEEYYDKQELSQMLGNAADEIRRIKGQSAGITQAANQTWASVFQNLAGLQGITSSNIEITKESPGASLSLIQETLLEVTIKAVPLRALIQILYQVDHGTPPMRLKGAAIDPGESGLLNARLNVSGYMPKKESDKDKGGRK